MIKHQYKNIKILYIFMCLKALHLYNKQKKYKFNSFSHIIPIMNLYDIIYTDKYDYTNILNITNHISYAYKKINIILRHEAKRHTISSKNISKIYYQYLKQYIYIYQKHYKSNIKQKTNQENDTDRLAMTHLYCLYKILHTKNKFITYKYLHQY